MLRPLSTVFSAEDYPNLLVGLDSADDAAIWKLDDTRSLVFTTDFFTPVVDNPYDYGAIAAANSLSDVYAMGGKPFLALNIAALPPDLPLEISTEIVRGAAEKAREAGVVIAGGHSIQDKEPKFGLAVLGMLQNSSLLTKDALSPGDHLFLTKPLGFGVLATAHKRGLLSEVELAEVVGWMKQLNLAACALATSCSLRAATDITGFGLLGHLSEMITASGCGARLRMSAIPLVSCARKYALIYTFPGGASDNRLYFEPQVQFAQEISEDQRMLLFDPQTSGGLLLAVPEEKLSLFRRSAEAADTPTWEIGLIEAGPGIQVLA